MQKCWSSANFTSFLSIFEEKNKAQLPELNLFELTGNTRDRSIPVESFENEASSALMLASLKAMVLSNIKSADYVFLMDPWWNPAAEDQAIDRCFKLGRINPPLFTELSQREQLKIEFDSYN